MTKFDAFITKYVNEIRSNNKPENVRYGQLLMNMLHDFDKEQWTKITSTYYHDETDIDCYYRDKLMSNTLRHLMEEWKNELAD